MKKSAASPKNITSHHKIHNYTPKDADKPLVSVIVPVFNVAKYLNQCIASITNQTYQNLEIILINDGSTDNSPTLCDAWCQKDHRIRVINQENLGLADARNTGIKHANGEYLAFVDSDDWLEPQFIETLIKSAQDSNSDISIVGRFLEYANSQSASAHEPQQILSPEACLKRIFYNQNLDQSAADKLYKAELFTKKHILFPSGKEHEDTTTICQIITQAHTISFYPIPLYHYRKNNSDSITHAPFSIKKLDLIDLSTKATEKIIHIYPDLTRAGKCFLMHAYLSTLARAYQTKEPDQKVIQELFAYTKQHRAAILKDREAPTTVKIALLTTFLGPKFYYFVWKYLHARKERP